MQNGFGLLQVNRLRDYFASCLPFIQKGDVPTIATVDAAQIQEMYNNTYSSVLNVNTNGTLNYGYKQEIKIEDANNNTYTLANSGDSSTVGNVETVPDGTSFTPDLYQN